jgi:hypothetical protein
MGLRVNCAAPSVVPPIVILLALFAFAPAVAAPPTAEDVAIDAAIDRGLKFLASAQRPSHAWTIDSFGESTAATSLAVMSFLAAGYLPGEPPHGERLERGIAWVIRHQEPGRMIVHQRTHGPFYSHGISTLMLAEVVGMLDAQRAVQCRQALEKGVGLILDAQNVAKSERHAGGWRYQPHSRDSDLSVSGWQLLALRAAKNVGCDVPAENIDRAIAYVKMCADAESGGFAYQPGGGTTPTRTGTGILALEICGDHHSAEALRGAEYLQAKPLAKSQPYFYYGAYYCTVGMFKVGGEHWEAMKAQIYPLLLASQTEDGSWLAEHGGERAAGKVYCTCMALLALAVEYRYLPIYQN